MMNSAPASKTTQTRLMAIGIRHEAVELIVWQPKPTQAPITCPIANMSCQLDTQAPRISIGGISDRYSGALGLSKFPPRGESNLRVGDDTDTGTSDQSTDSEETVVSMFVPSIAGANSRRRTDNDHLEDDTDRDKGDSGGETSFPS